MTKPVLVRADGTLGPTALKMVEDMAAEGKTQRSIASALGLSKKKFEKMLDRNKGDNPERLAWEAGHSVIEQTAKDLLWSKAQGNGKDSAIALFFFCKTQLGWTEKPDGSLVQDNRIQITLPGPLSREDFYKSIGIEAPLDFRKDKSKAHPLLPGSGDGDGKRAPSGMPAAAISKPEKEPSDGK